MEEKFSNIWQYWHNYLVTWTRDKAPKLLVILVLSFIFVRLLGLITRKLVAISDKVQARGAGRRQQVRTVTGVIRSVGVFLIVFFTGMSVLKDAFNINIEPLLASAGIAGLAVGFGAQTLVKDVINGFFILVEDQFEVGETIRAAGVSGTVEEITMRRTTLRDRDGTLHIVPNGSIQIVSNMTRDWSQVTLHVSADYGENSDRVVELLEQVATEFYGDARFKDDVVSEPQVPGIERVRGNEVDYLMLVKVRPGKQYGVARELRRRIKAAFEKNNIKAGAPAQVYIGQMPNLSAVGKSMPDACISAVRSGATVNNGFGSERPGRDRRCLQSGYWAGDGGGVCPRRRTGGHVRAYGKNPAGSRRAGSAARPARRFTPSPWMLPTATLSSVLPSRWPSVSGESMSASRTQAGRQPRISFPSPPTNGAKRLT